MTALLELPAFRERVARLSVEEYHRLGELPVELLRGTIIEKMPKSPLHQFYVDRLRQILTERIQPEFTVRQEGPLTFGDSEPEPDVAVVVGPPERYLQHHPTTAELVIEVAVSSLEIDRVKEAIYAEAGVKEYWIVSPEEKRIEIYRSPSPRGYGLRLELSEGTATCESLPGLEMALTALFPV